MSGKTILFVLTPMISAVLSAVLTRRVRRWSTARGFVDHPGGRKSHEAPVALGGGLVILLAVGAPIILAAVAGRLWSAAPPAWLPELARTHLGGIGTRTPAALALIAAAAAMCALGLYDDLRPMSARAKFSLQAAVAAVLVVGFDLRLLSHWGMWPSTILSMLWVLTLVNALNFLDNTDGLAAGVGIIVSTVLACTAMAAGQMFVPVCCLLLAGALAGFIPYNYSPATIFLGDAGSMLIGFLLAVFTILTTFADPGQGQRPLGVIAPLVIMAVPLYDTMSVMVLRWRSGAPLWTGDRRHFSHRLIERGLSPRQAVQVIWLATLVTALPALLLPRASWSLAWGIIAQTILVTALVALLESARKE